MNWQERLQRGCAALGVDLDAAAQERLLAYLELLAKWNRVHNLTAVRDPEQMVAQHLLDSLAVLPRLAACNSLIDVGSGGGLPGIPLAIARPQMAVTLLDSSAKKTAFLRQAQLELGLDNLVVVCARVEAYQPETPFEVVISRAFADLSEFAALAAHLCAPNGVLLAMKGLYPYEEIERLPSEVAMVEVVPLRVPELEAQRHLAVLKKV